MEPVEHYELKEQVGTEEVFVGLFWLEPGQEHVLRILKQAGITHYLIN